MEEKIVEILEQMQKQVVDMQNEIKQDIKSLQEGQDEIKQDIKSLQEGQDEIKQDIKSLQEGQDEIKKDVKAIYERTAKLTEFQTVTKQDLVDIKDTLKFVLHKEAEQEKELFLLKEKQNKVQ